MLKILESKKEYVDKFINESYRNWLRKPGKKLDVNDDKLLMYLITNHAYGDTYIRVQKKLIESAKYNSEERRKVYQELIQNIRFWLNSDDEDYDTWHKITCEQFVSDFNSRVGCGQYEPIRFGKGQKMVNMMMKYLSSCENAEEYASRFEKCHMPLDSRILDSFYYAYVKKGVPYSERKKWTKLSYEEYKKITDDIRNYFMPFGKSPFVEEWVIWDRISNGLAPV